MSRTISSLSNPSSSDTAGPGAAGSGTAGPGAAGSGTADLGAA